MASEGWRRSHCLAQLRMETSWFPFLWSAPNAAGEQVSAVRLPWDVMPMHFARARRQHSAIARDVLARWIPAPCREFKFELVPRNVEVVRHKLHCCFTSHSRSCSICTFRLQHHVRLLRLKVISSPVEECTYVAGAECYDQGNPICEKKLFLCSCAADARPCWAR